MRERKISDASQTIIIENTGQFDRVSEVAILVCLNGDNRGWCFVLTEEKNVIGTTADCEVVVYDRAISSRHATLKRGREEWVLTDLDSLNGTFWHGQKVGQVPLASGDTFRTGRTEWRFFYTPLRTKH